MSEPERPFLRAFADPEAVARYAEGAPRFVPGFEALHRMTAILLGERTPSHARVLVLGAGGGLELRALALAHPGWTFVGVDPARPMLDLAARTLGPLAARVELVEGYVDDAPDGPFDAAACLLTLHILDAPERLRTAQAIHRRLKAGAPFVMANNCLPAQSRTLWLDRYAAYAVASGADPAQALAMRNAIEASATLFTPEQDEANLREAGFGDAELFYSAFTWRGWIGHA